MSLDLLINRKQNTLSKPSSLKCSSTIVSTLYYILNQTVVILCQNTYMSPSLCFTHLELVGIKCSHTDIPLIPHSSIQIYWGKDWMAAANHKARRAQSVTSATVWEHCLAGITTIHHGLNYIQTIVCYLNTTYEN